MKTIIQQFQNELTSDERRLFEANAALAGRRPGMHLKYLLFGETEGALLPRRRRAKKSKVQGPKSFDLRPSTFDLRPSTFDLRPSTFDLRPST